MSRGHVCAVVGGQYGSEGKGVIVNFLADKYGVHVRVGGPNAGHSFYHDGQVFKMQSVPCGWTNPKAICVLGRGILINPVILKKEIATIREFAHDIDRRLVIDRLAGVLDDNYHHRLGEGGVNGALHHRIGSTGEGVGAARLDRIKRDPDLFQLAYEIPNLEPFLSDDTPGVMYDAVTNGEDILLEGTQGSGLSLVHGPWPYVTSADTNAAQLCADAGIPPRFVDQTILVLRTFPIRVAGNSGPLKDELTWEEVSAYAGRPVCEKTTVTQKTRRVGKWDPELVKKAIHLNAPTSVAITFMDYLFPECEGVCHWIDMPRDAKAWVYAFEDEFQVGVSMVGTGGNPWRVVATGADL
jgi:adenylosuccinate synthase